MPRLLISAAHTTENPGAVFQDLREADLTRKLLALCLPYLDAKKIDYKAVPLDLPLIQRIEWINNSGFSEANGDIFVELHINDGGKRGVEGWYKGNTSPENRSQRLTQTLVEYICKTTGYLNQGAKSEYEHELTSLLILNSTNPTGTCIEALYLDNPEDIAIIKDNSKMNDLAKTIVDGIEAFFKDDAVRPKPLAQQVNNPNGLQNNSAQQFSQQFAQPQFNNDPTSSGAFQPNSNPSFRPQQNSAFSPPQNGQPQGMPYTPQANSNGGFGGNNFGSGQSAFGGGFGGGNKPAAGGNNGMLMDREQRKEMIKKTYSKILGKEILQNDLNYYLNLGSSEEELVKKLIEHADFTALVHDSAEAKELRGKMQKMEGELALVQSNLNDTKSLQTSLSQLLEQKNIMIQRLYQELQNNKILLEGQHIDSLRPKVDPALQGPKKRESAGRKIFKRMMKVAKV